VAKDGAKLKDNNKRREEEQRSRKKHKGHRKAGTERRGEALGVCRRTQARWILITYPKESIGAKEERLYQQILKRSTPDRTSNLGERGPRKGAVYKTWAATTATPSHGWWADGARGGKGRGKFGLAFCHSKKALKSAWKRSPGGKTTRVDAHSMMTARERGERKKDKASSGRSASLGREGGEKVRTLG